MKKRLAVLVSLAALVAFLAPGVAQAQTVSTHRKILTPAAVAFTSTHTWAVRGDIRYGPVINCRNAEEIAVYWTVSEQEDSSPVACGLQWLLEPLTAGTGGGKITVPGAGGALTVGHDWIDPATTSTISTNSDGTASGTVTNIIQVATKAPFCRVAMAKDSVCYSDRVTQTIAARYVLRARSTYMSGKPD